MKVQNRLTKLFEDKKNNILSIFVTAGYPEINDTITNLKALEESGVDMVEIGIPFSDPLADGPVIQASSGQALKNGMSLKLLFEQLKQIRENISMPLVLMGYLNPVLQYGIEAFCDKCCEIGIDGVILPDLPLDIYQKEYEGNFIKNNLSNIFLISPQTSNERVKKIDAASNGFIYMVSSSSTTGIKKTFSSEQQDYFLRIKNMELENPVIVGFGISDKPSFENACKYANGAIIGTAFIKALEEGGNLTEKINHFVKSIKE